MFWSSQGPDLKFETRAIAVPAVHGMIGGRVFAGYLLKIASMMRTLWNNSAMAPMLARKLTKRG